MKKLFFILFMFVSFAVNAESNVVSNDSTALTLNKVYEDVKEGIQGLAVALKAPAEHVYEIVIKQQVVKSVSYLTTWLILLLPLFTINWWLKKIRNSTYANEDGWIAGLVFLGLIPVCISIIGLAVTSSEIITGFVNPEYGAIKDIMSFIK